MATAKKLPSGNFHVRIYDKSTDSYKSFTAPTKKKAEFLATEFILKNKTAPENITVGEAIENYINSKENILSVSTVRGYHVILNNAVEAIKNISLANITEVMLQSWINENSAKYSSKSINNQFGLVIAALKQNKVFLDYGNILLKPKQKKETQIPTIEEMGIILKIVEGTSVELPVTIALTLGLRQSEIHALHWSDYDGKNLHINKASVPDKNNKMVEKKTNKSYAGTRTLEVNSILKERLDKSIRTSDLISPMLPSRITRKFKKLCIANGLKPYTLHAQRHGNASIMLLEGVPDKYAMERLGQSTTNMLKTVYQHTFKEEQEKISDKMSNVFEELYDTKYDTKNIK